jgi:carbamoyl-phosphate synthase/aspartate carbamoyltransferase/dihydroorotase
MKPPLGTQADQDALWAGVTDRTIDLVETDHAPHTVSEKAGEPAPFGVPGLETAAGLLGRAIHDERLTEADVIRLLHEAPKRIFSIPAQPDTYVELDWSEPYRIGEGAYHSKAGWSPFEGWEAYGRMKTVVLRGKPLVTDGVLIG